MIPRETVEKKEIIEIQEILRTRVGRITDCSSIVQVIYLVVCLISCKC
jgi:hypothetical protein